ncbi:MAG: dTDP-4-dehydrorhamnose 3,5-epimerase [Brevinematales bacterium]|nr:dTDP-4-dehydrorhamnose 3,5-epimerase [Brevinematales bacterium]
MKKFDVKETNLEGVVIIEPKVFKDERGFFLESWNEKVFQEIGLNFKFVQDNHSRSLKGVIRGLHFQDPFPQGKLVRVVRGMIFDVAVDIRKGSPTFGKWVSVYLSDENLKMLYIPEGFAHGFLVVSDIADVLYKTTEFYYPEYDKGIVWNDKDINIKWPLEEFGIINPIISTKDSNLPRLRDIL